MPRLTSGSSDYSDSLNLIGSNSTTNASGTREEKDKSMDTAMASVVKSMSGPGETAKMLVEQVRKYKWVIAGSGGIALVISILYTFLLKIAAFPVMLTIMAAVWVMLGVSLAMLGSKAGYIDAASIPGSDYAATKMPEGVTFGPAETNQQLVVAACVLVGVCFVFYSLVLCVMIPRLRLACKIIDLASVCLASMPTALLIPVIQFFAAGMLFVYFCIVLWYLASAGSWDPDARRYVWDENLQRMMLVHFFGLL
jgi:hypothetical protein